MFKRTENVEKRRIQALKALFKKVVRIVSLNNPWIHRGHDNDEEEDHPTSVKKNISILVRSKAKAGFLSAADKAIIRTPHESRTIPERRKLCSLFATLRCLARFTPKMRARLVPVMRLLAIKPGRNIMSQLDFPITVFFIMMGEVRMINGEDKQGNELVEAIFRAGDVIGHADLLEGRNRTRTFKSSTYCELLVLFDYDFAEIVGPYMTKIWDEKKRALKALDYFDFLDNDQIVDACRLAKLKQYKSLDSIYCDDEGSLTNVHFVLSGECLILQCLNMVVTKKKGKRVFKLMAADETSRMFSKGERSTFTAQTKHIGKTHSNLEMAELVASSSSSSYYSDKNSLKHLMRKMNLRDIEMACGLVKEMEPRLTWRRKSSHFRSRKSVMKYSDDDQGFIEEEVYEDHWEAWEDEDEEDKPDSNNPYEFKNEIIGPASFSQWDQRRSERSDFFFRSSSSCSLSSDDGIKPVYDSRFIDVGSLTFGGIFGLGEKMENRVIMARTTVQCLTLPRFFLLETKQNPGNIWERRLFYLECMIPSREALFEHFLKTCEWKKFKNNFIYQSLKYSDKNGAHINDIPIICRIVESPDDVN